VRFKVTKRVGVTTGEGPGSR